MRVMMIGNSYTFYNQMPALLQQQADAVVADLSIETCLRGGKDWSWHLDEGEARAMLADGSWDMVVMQNHSRAALAYPDRMMADGRRIAALAGDAKLVLYMTWARAHSPEAIDIIAPCYQQLAQVIDAEVAPVGLAFAEALKRDPSLCLYDPDQSHPAPAGSYLALCLLYHCLTDSSPATLPDRLLVDDEPVIDLPESTGRLLRAVACELAG